MSWVPVFYIAVAAGLERKSRKAWMLALTSSLLTISANVIWIRIYGTGPQVQGTFAGLAFNLVVLTILILYWFTIIGENPSPKITRISLISLLTRYRENLGKKRGAEKPFLNEV